MDAQAIYDNFRETFPTSGFGNYSVANDPSIQTTISRAESNLARGDQVKQSSVVAENVRRAQQAAKVAASAEAAKNYSKVLNNAGGYTFLDPNGSPISAADYAAATGVPVSQAISGSKDPNDLRYQIYANAMAQDVANGRYDVKTGMSLLAHEFPAVFGINQPAQAGYADKARRDMVGGADIAGIESAVNNSVLNPRDSTYGTNGPKGQAQALNGVLSKIQAAPDYNTASRIKGDYLLNLNSAGLDSATRKSHEDAINNVLGDLYYFGGAALPTSAASNLF